MIKEYTICTLDKAQYILGDTVKITINSQDKIKDIKLFVLNKEVEFNYEIHSCVLSLINLPIGNYGIEITGESFYWESSFDIVLDKNAAVRYGFLTDFSSCDNNLEAVEWIKNLHLNAVQFYDWMFRHDKLISPTEEYIDPLGRSMNKSVVKEKALACQKFGIRPFAYGAVYAATKETLEMHPEWGIYTMDKKAMSFADWLYFMNISKDSGWSKYIIDEYAEAISFGFQGIHMDTYGFPKRVWDYKSCPLDLAEDFPQLINNAFYAVSQKDKDAGVIFNAVNNWPMEAVANTKQDAIYIEVWPPNDTYLDLYTLIREAHLCADKPVVLAAYLKPFENSKSIKSMNAFRLCWAAICASGGTQLVLGENACALKDSYYVNYAKLEESFLPCVQRYCDFLVRYAELLYNDRGVYIGKTSSGGINEDIIFTGSCKFSLDAKENTVWLLIRERASRITINLINLCENNAMWNEEKEAPKIIDDIGIQMRLDRKVLGIYAASPDISSISAQELSYSYESTEQGRIYNIPASKLEFWSTIWIDLEE